MKRAGTWCDDITSSDSSSSDSDDEGSAGEKLNNKANSREAKKSKKGTQAGPGKKRGVLDYNALNRHGYKGGLSVLKVLPPKVVNDSKQDWSWSTGERKNADAERIKESYDDRERTRAAANTVEKLSTSHPNLLADGKDKKNVSFSQKEKRKRDLGQASRGKNYVEEEKRLLRDSGVYSGFDS